MTRTALIIDDEPDIRELVSITVSRLGLDCHAAANLSEARNLLDAYPIDVCLTDMRLPDGNGVDFVSYMQEHHPDIPVAVITAHGSMDAAVTAMKNGAFDFVSKPVNLKLLRKLIESAANAAAVQEKPLPASETDKSGRQNANPSHVEDNTSTAEDTVGEELDARLLGQSAPMQQLKKMIRKLARSQAPVLINGESGTGKELVARLIHDCGPRATGPFIPVNCGAIPAELMESEFFGHKKGSFTGATEDKPGLFQAAEDGTLFLDEVAELPLFMQVKLLRVIQEKAVKPVGATHEIPINVRIISASYKNLEQEVAESRFRHDLYYRLNVIGLQVPPLRERREDIPALVHFTLARIAERWGDAPFPVSDAAMQALMSFHYAGNVRELENVLERAVTLAEGEALSPEDLNLQTSTASAPPQISNVATEAAEPAPASVRYQASLNQAQDAETQLILTTLQKHQWNRKAAAEELGLSYRQLRYRLQKIQAQT
ncbi:sigma-54 dependent transcriptional regulator [Granulosicoccaceae sp. 1_MG-2023]|nr:sigma-54 dependent transcriptional regulator [Granulosicoccaceae sp. 1_MG-2023]